MHSPHRHSAFSRAEQIARTRLIRTETIGPITFRQLISRFGTGEKAVDGLPDFAARRARKKPLRIAPRAEAERELEALTRAGGTPLFLGAPEYPARLAATEDAPPLLHALGHPALLARDSIAVVGPRNTSAAGAKMAHLLASALSKADLVIVSGMARGVDAASHQASLEGGTVACLAGGADHIYPLENTSLYHNIVAQGCVVSEMPLGTRPQARHFPRRNRIISGLSLGVLVVEAAERSGTLITARLAAEQGREVFAVPGSPLDPRAKGTNGLIRDGAVLVETAADVLAELESLRHRPIAEDEDLPLFAASPSPPEADPDLADHIVALLGPTPVHIDDIIRLTEAPAGAVQAALLMLELSGEAVRYPGARVARIDGLDA